MSSDPSAVDVVINMHHDDVDMPDHNGIQRPAIPLLTSYRDLRPCSNQHNLSGRLLR